jgi:hypothetical protein
MLAFQRIMVVDWSARATPSPRRESADAIWIAECDIGDGAVRSWYLRTRSDAMRLLDQRFRAALANHARVLCGFDFPFGYPAGFAAGVTGEAAALSVWGHLARRVEDADDNGNNRFRVAAELNAFFPGIGPFWGCPVSVDLPGLPAKGTHRTGFGLPHRRLVESRVPRAQPCWKLYTTGSVGSQSLLGLARLEHLRRTFPDVLAVWPFEPRDRPIVLSEIYPSLLDSLVNAALDASPRAIKDDVQVRLLAGALAEMARRGSLATAMSAASGPHLHEEGWILGVGCEADLRDAGRAAAASAHRA